MSRCLLLPVVLLALSAAPSAALAADRDHDRLPDRWERHHGLSTTARSWSADPDHDRLRTGREYRLRTNPRRADSDRDGLGDRAELRRHTNPRRRDTDRDGVTDGSEVRAGSNPLDRDDRPAVGSRRPPAPKPEPAPVPPPAAGYTFSPSTPRAGEPVAFDARSSTCPAAPCTYTWQDVGADGSASWPLGSGRAMRFTFRNAGTKYVRLTVRDARGRAVSRTRNVAVRAASAPTPAPTPTPAPAPTPTPTPTPDPTPGTCDRNATTATFAAQVSAASAGETICLAAGGYGTWSGTNKAITVRAADGAAVTMGISFDTGDSGFTVDGLTIPGGAIRNGARNIVIRNSAFTSQLTITGLANANVLLDHNTHLDIDAAGQTTSPARIHLSYSSSTPSGVTIQNSLLAGGDSDGVQTGVGVNIIGNEFRDILEDGPNHTDAIQLLGAQGSVVRGNYIHNTATGIVAYDGLTRATIEDNLVDLRGHRPWGIELYSDDSSVVRHNTLIHGSCYFNLPCGIIDVSRKTQDDAGRGTVVVDNIATQLSIGNGSAVAERHHNLLRQGSQAGDVAGSPAFVGGTALTSYGAFRLASGSPGVASASDGSDIGI